MESVLTTTQELLIEKIRTRSAKVGVIGLGYVSRRSCSGLRSTAGLGGYLSSSSFHCRQAGETCEISVVSSLPWLSDAFTRIGFRQRGQSLVAITTQRSGSSTLRPCTLE